MDNTEELLKKKCADLENQLCSLKKENNTLRDQLSNKEKLISEIDALYNYYKTMYLCEKAHTDRMASFVNRMF